MFKIHLLPSIFLKKNGKHIQNLLLNSALSLKNQPELPVESKIVADEWLMIKKEEIRIYSISNSTTLPTDTLYSFFKNTCKTKL